MSLPTTHTHTHTCPAKIPQTPMMQRMLKTAEPTMVPTPTSPWVMKTPAHRKAANQNQAASTIWECQNVCTLYVYVCICVYQWQMQKALEQNCQLPWTWLLQHPRSDLISAEPKQKLVVHAVEPAPSNCNSERWKTPRYLTDLLQRCHKVLIARYGEGQKHVEGLERNWKSVNGIYVWCVLISIR